LKKKILIIAPHADDETLGCGGTILKHKDVGDEVHYLLISELEENKGNEIKKKSYEIQISKMIKFYNFKSSNRLKLFASKLDSYSISYVIEKIQNILKKVKPDTIYLPFSGDIHSDHNIVFKASLASAKWFRSPSVKEILLYETISETNLSIDPNEFSFKPNLYKNITKFLNMKLKALDIYKTEIRRHPFPRSKDAIKSLAILRGSEAGFKYAESFILIKKIEK
tara:strand:+ start:31 stop:702 length:672 start_codon:yes stop_codon:yes gene_type:complete